MTAEQFEMVQYLSLLVSPILLMHLDQNVYASLIYIKASSRVSVGEFLAAQLDDRTVKIWKTSDLSIEAEVKKPFEDSPGSTFFRRLRCDFFFLSSAGILYEIYST